MLETIEKKEVPIIQEEIFYPQHDARWGGAGMSLMSSGGGYSPEDYHLTYGRKKQHGGHRALNLGRDSYIWCFSGPRGAGKTSLMSYIAEQSAYLYQKRIISNYPIEFRVWVKHAETYYTIRSEPLELGKLLMFDESYQGAIIVIDEAPQIINRLATMTWKNRLLDLWLQQIRKNNNSLLYASQNEGWVDNELRWQTDILTNCRDGSILYPGHQRGSLILSKTKDLSGLWTGYSYDERPRIVKKQRHLTKFIWDTFDTFHKNDVFESLAKVKMNVGEIRVGIEGGSDEDYLDNAVPIIAASMEMGKIKKRDFAEAIGELDHKAKDEMYKRLRTAGVNDCGHGEDSYNFAGFDMDKFMNWKKR